MPCTLALTDLLNASTVNHDDMVRSANAGHAINLYIPIHDNITIFNITGLCPAPCHTYTHQRTHPRTHVSTYAQTLAFTPPYTR